MLYLILSSAVTVCAGIGFSYGIFRFFREKSALYIRMIVFSVGCAMFGRLFESLQLIANGYIAGGFHVGVLGIAGSFLFLFSANYGQMDSIVDDGSEQFKKTKLISLIAPLAVLGMWCILVVSKGFNKTTVAYGVETLVIAPAVYFNFKHLIIEDVDFGLIRAIRLYNLLAIVYAFLCMAEMFVKSFNNPLVFIIIIYVLQCLVLLAIIPVLERGVKTWTT